MQAYSWAQSCGPLTIVNSFNSNQFGNLISNIDAALIERFRLPLVHAGNHAFPLLRTYGDTRPGDYLALINSFGVVEIARAEQSAAEGLGLSRGAPVTVRDRTE